MARKKKSPATIGDTELDSQPQSRDVNVITEPQPPQATQSTLVICRNKYVISLDNNEEIHAVERSR